MTLTVELPGELGARLEREAGRRGLSVDRTVVDLLDRATRQEWAEPPVDDEGNPVLPPDDFLAVALAGLTGVIHSRELHAGAARCFSQDETSYPAHLERKRQAGTL
jgi:hypothetical protein